MNESKMQMAPAVTRIEQPEWAPGQPQAPAELVRKLMVLNGNFMDWMFMTFIASAAVKLGMENKTLTGADMTRLLNEAHQLPEFPFDDEEADFVLRHRFETRAHIDGCGCGMDRVPTAEKDANEKPIHHYVIVIEPKTLARIKDDQRVVNKAA